MRAWALIIGLVLFGLVAKAAEGAVYSQYKECTISSYGECNDFKADLLTKTISFNFILKYNPSGREIEGINSISIAPQFRNYYNNNVEIEQPEQLCKDLRFGLSQSSLSNVEIESSIDSIVYVYASECSMEDGKWLSARIIITPKFINESQQGRTPKVQPDYYYEYQNFLINGNIMSFIEGPDYKKDHETDNLVRFFPLILIVGISLVGLVRVNR